ncbi:hypothetical protein PEX2_029050 [Penicillium expansum]|uniref:Uncharacterized protein n=1 Tax=Penicillium expansum TaxID=27334 RepID=A0A0A2JSS2_PENEN|nr:hypothetical protein PEX2_029050 [Penicillium expansum]KGO46102.1 hypothetical protein PEXP_017440 [Penicillium expansum]KGO55265.1 hypothetical protein PEX2_029050 [Penicillium expansum]
MLKSILINLCVLGFLSCTLAIPSKLGQRDNTIAQRDARFVEFTTRKLTDGNPGEKNTENSNYEQIAEGW